jgi:hypothetical protein
VGRRTVRGMVEGNIPTPAFSPPPHVSRALSPSRMGTHR